MTNHTSHPTVPEWLASPTPMGVSRRGLLGLGGALAAGTLLGGCQIQTTEDPPAGGANDDFEITFPEARADLPSDDVSFRTMLAGGGPTGAFDVIFKAFQKAHPNITIDNPQTTWDTLNEAVTLGVRNGSAPDLFSKPTTVPMQVAHSE